MSTVTADSIRINDSDAAGGWSKYNGGGGSPASEPQRVYQGVGVVGNKAASLTTRVGVDYLHGSGTDVTLPANALVLLKGTVDDNSDLNPVFGLELSIGTSEGAHFEYNVAGSAAVNDWHKEYNAVGGVAAAYIFAAIDPNIAGWRDPASPGGATLTNIRWFALGAQFVGGAAKNENVGLDAIDIGTGLTYTGTDFTFQDAVDEDQGIVNNRWGWAVKSNGAIVLRGMHNINAGGTDTSVVFFPDGMHSTGLAGVRAESSAEYAGSYTGLGRYYGGVVGTDTRPDFTVPGGSSPTLSGAFGGWRLFNLSNGTLVTGSLECVDLIPNGATFDGATIRTNWSANNATVDDPDLAKFTATKFEQAGAGHAIRITVPGAYNIDQLRFIGYGPDGAGDAAILNDSGGLVTLERLDPNTPAPSVRNGTGATTDIPGVQSQLSITGVPAGLEARFRQGAYTLLELPDIQNGEAVYAYIYEGVDRPVTISIGGVADDGTAYERREIKLNLTVNNQAIPFEIILNPSYAST